MPIPCSNCKEPVQSEASECPHCGDTKMTSGKYRQYLYLWLPVTAAVMGLILFALFEASSPVVTVWWMPATILILYALGWEWARSQRSDHKSYVEHHQGES